VCLPCPRLGVGDASPRKAPGSWNRLCMPGHRRGNRRPGATTARRGLTPTAPAARRG